MKTFVIVFAVAMLASGLLVSRVAISTLLFFVSGMFASGMVFFGLMFVAINNGFTYQFISEKGDLCSGGCEGVSECTPALQGKQLYLPPPSFEREEEIEPSFVAHDFHMLFLMIINGTTPLLTLFLATLLRDFIDSYRSRKTDYSVYRCYNYG